MTPEQLENLIKELTIKVDHYGQESAQIDARRGEVIMIIEKLRDIQSKQKNQAQ